MPLTSLDDALDRILSDVLPVSESASCPLGSALGRVLAADVFAPLNVPPADNSAMDGYALRVRDWQGEALPVSQRIAAGCKAEALQPGSVARIFTGAEIPGGADTVVMQENARQEGDRVIFSVQPQVGENIRPAGQDIARGSCVFSRGHRLRAEDLGVLASIGCAEVVVFRKPRVGVFSTGDELVEPGTELAAGQIYNSNRYTLQGLIIGMGCEFVDYGIVADSASATRDTLSRAAADCDCVITSGGVSVGEEDHVKAQVEALGELSLWKLAIKPGKPLAYGRIHPRLGEGHARQAAGTPFFGLPGNPAAVYVTFNLLARPYLLALGGASELHETQLRARASFNRADTSVRQQYLRARLACDATGMTVDIHSNQSSGVLSALSWANALVVVPPDTPVRAGDSVAVLLLDSWG